MAPVAPARTTRLESLVPAATPNTSPETETAPSSIPKVMSPIATRDCDIKRRSAPTAACNIRNLQVRPTDPTLAAGLEHRPGRFLLFGDRRDALGCWVSFSWLRSDRAGGGSWSSATSHHRMGRRLSLIHISEPT